MHLFGLVNLTNTWPKQHMSVLQAQLKQMMQQRDAAQQAAKTAAERHDAAAHSQQVSPHRIPCQEHPPFDVNLAKPVR